MARLSRKKSNVAQRKRKKAAILMRNYLDGSYYMDDWITLQVKEIQGMITAARQQGRNDAMYHVNKKQYAS